MINHNHLLSGVAVFSPLSRAVRPVVALGVLLIGLAGCSKEAATPEPNAGQVVTQSDAVINYAQTGFSTQNGGTNGGAGGSTVTATTLAQLTSYATSSSPLIIRIDRKISAGTQGASIRVASNKTLIGVGTAGFLEGVGLTISGTRNIIIQNLKFTMSTVTNTYTNSEGRQQVAVNDGDCITIQSSSANIWIDHCEFYNKDPRTQTNQDLYDGLIDAKNSSAYITVSWSYFHDHHKSHLVGSSDSDTADRRMTFHHNYYSNIKERLPSYRGGTAHVFNNYFLNITGSGINSRVNACVRAEKNSFENTRDPLVSKNSSVLGKWQAISNLYGPGCSGSQPTNSSCTFTPPYSYTGVLNAETEVKAVVTANAGIGKI